MLASTTGAWLVVQDGLVVEHGDHEAPKGARVVGDVVFSPGFVDLQVNGVGPVDFWRADPDEWRAAGRNLLESGVTSYLPTLVSAPRDGYADALARVAAARADAADVGLPHIEGVHLEGPFLGDAPGAHPPELLGPVDLDWVLALLDSQPGLVRLVTVAPEADPDLLGTRALVERGVVVALGHSRCSYEAAVEAAGAGATLVTHLFNGMGPLSHRAPGLPGAALDDDRFTPTLIADFVHVHPAVLRLAALRKHCILVTDAVAVDVEYFGHRVTGRDGAAYLDNGTLAGSTLTMDRAVRNMESLVGLPRALDMVTISPARAVSMDSYAARGVGGRADLVALHRSTLEVVGVWLAGEPAYARP
ncbi:MAG: N-acetylglucosamine-6-phosphate deacetylase [Acidimicrobiia bacterium]